MMIIYILTLEEKNLFLYKQKKKKKQIIYKKYSLKMNFYIETVLKKILNLKNFKIMI